MENETNETKIGIGNEEFITLKAAPVLLKSINIETKGDKGSKIAVFLCKHPEKDELIHISRVKYENKGVLETVGLWINKDTKGLIRKGSALAVFLQFNNGKRIDDLLNKVIMTTTYEKGYLCFKAY